jgi:hypothetical protein
MRVHSALFFCLILLFACSAPNPNEAQSSKVEIVREGEGHYRMYVNGQPYVIQGAGCEYGNVRALAHHGANSFRTWRTENGQQSGQEVLDSAQAAGLMVMMGLEIQRERHGFDYNDPQAVSRQLDYVRAEVLKYRNHPALLAWGIGNELNLNAQNMKVWDAVNEISKMIHQLDPNHPTTTMLAGINKKDIDYIKTNCADLDFIGIQMYGDIVNLQKRLLDAGYDGPYVVSEWGATGHWEVKNTSWGAPIEQTSKEKAAAFLKRYRIAIETDKEKCLGSYAFLWGHKQEKTPTWYGLFLETGERTEPVDMLHLIWNGDWPENRCPSVDSLLVDNRDVYQDVQLNPGQTVVASVWAHDPEFDHLTYRWELLPESFDPGVGGDPEVRPASIWANVGGSEIQLQAPLQPGAYRLFVTITDRFQGAATANFPFLVINHHK